MLRCCFLSRSSSYQWASISNQRKLQNALVNCRHHSTLTSNRGPPPTIPRRNAGPPKRGSIQGVKHVLAVGSGKGGVGKSTMAVNLAVSLSLLKDTGTSKALKVGILDLDVFGPSVPTLMGLRSTGEAEVTPNGRIIPLANHGIPTMSIAYLISRSGSNPPSNDGTTPAMSEEDHDKPIVWRGLMVQKAVQDMLFNVDWTWGSGSDLDVLVIDMPPGTGDVALTLGQLVKVDGSVIVSTPQDVALSDVRKGISMFRKVDIPITGIILNQSYFTCPSCTEKHSLFGEPDKFRDMAGRLGVDILAEFPVLKGISWGGDRGVPYALLDSAQPVDAEWKDIMSNVAQKVWNRLYK